MSDTELEKNKGFDIQETLSIGYIYLLILGVIHNAIYYNFIGVNYLEYSSILDVLISPISVITSSFKSIIIFILLIVFSLIYVKVLIPLTIKFREKRKRYQTEKGLKRNAELKGFSKSSAAIFVIIALATFGYFIGLGYGQGAKNKKKIAENNIEHNTKIDFINGKSIEVDLLGKNTLNIFYIQKGDTSVSISPIDGNVMKVQKLNKKAE